MYGDLPYPYLNNNIKEIIFSVSLRFSLFDEQIEKPTDFEQCNIMLCWHYRLTVEKEVLLRN